MAIVGRPNVGKSTLLNKILGKALSITSKKPQTTRDRILGIKTQASKQTIYIDTPGINLKTKRLLNRRMNKKAFSAFAEVDVLVFLCEATSWTEDDEWICARIKELSLCPIVIAINKIDLLKDKKKLLPQIENLLKHISASAVVPISAQKDIQLDKLEMEIGRLLPERPHEFSKEQITDRTKSFLLAERVREKIMRLVGAEVPYHTAVTVSSLQEEKHIIRANIVIWVEKEGQKAILIGEKGRCMKKIGSQARVDLEKFFAKKVFLNLWVKVKPNWSEEERMLEQLEHELH